MPDGATPILVVDDDEVKRYTVTRTLQRAGYDVSEAVTGADALRRAAADPPALIVLDVQLPDISGYEVCRRLKADPLTAGIPVLHLSATFVGPDSKVQGLDSGADAFLTDAAEPPVLLATVRALLRVRRAEAALRESEAWHRASVEQVKEYAIFRTDVRGVAITWNEGVRRVLGYDEADFLGLDARELFTPEDQAAGVPEQELRDAADTGTANDDRWMRRRDGTRFWAGGATTGLRDAAGRLVGFTKVMRDRTAEKRAEDELKAADRAKDEFLATLAHELRNPLAPIRTGLAIQQQVGASPADVARAGEMMARQLGHLVRLIDDLLDVGRITRGRVDLRPRRVTLGEVLDAAVEGSRPLLDAGRHRLRDDRSADPIFLDADPTRLAQVVTNLLNNAARYTPDGGHVTLASRKENGQAVVRVTDDGAGIEPELLPRVWGPFTRSDRTLGRDRGGLGVGLTLVKRLVELHGGTVAAHSDGPGRGSEFVVRLPLAAGPAPVAPPVAHAPGSPPAGRRVLIVDDNRDGADTLALFLRLRGHAVTVAGDGPAGLAAAGDFRPQVVLLDLGLPGLDGYEVARRLRAGPDGRGLRLIALTGWGQDADRERSRQAGIDLHLVKPVDPAELARVLGDG